MRKTINLILILIFSSTLSACVTSKNNVIVSEEMPQPQDIKSCHCSRKVEHTYTIKNKTGLLKEKPAWQPTKVTSDGASVYIYLPAGTDVRPVLYVLDDKKNPWTLNYQVNKHYYRVDYLFKKAMLVYENQKVMLLKK